MGKVKYDINNYNYYVKCFIDISNNLGRPLTCHEIPIEKYNLPCSSWFIKNCPDKNVKRYSQFLEYIGLKPNRRMSKKLATEIIYNMQSKLDRPLMYDDFRNPSRKEISISIVNKYWGSLNKMKDELNIPIVQENMIDKQKSVEQIKNDLLKLCNKILKEENRKVISSQDINNCDFSPNWDTCQKILKIEFKKGVSDYIKSIGFETIKTGSGLIYNYNDGEIVKSQFEYKFSNFLRKINLIYNKDYIRDVKYKTFIKDYKNNMNCDYVITYQNRIIYIEIAGILRDYKEWYLDNISLNSKSKEKYRLKLMEKEKMLIENNLEYYILFPSDLQEDFLLSIFISN